MSPLSSHQPCPGGYGAGGGHGQAEDGEGAQEEDGQGQQQLGGPGHVLDMNHNSE